MSIPEWITPSGSLGTVIEGTPFSFSLDFTGSPSPSIEILSGNLPDGLVMDTFGNITGNIDDIPESKTYEFVIRLENIDGIIDRNFSINVDDGAVSWNDPSNLASINYYTEFEYQFSVIDDGCSTPQKFIKIGGQLPNGLYINSYGYLQGFVEYVDVDTTFEFTLRYSNDDKIIDKTFQIVVLNSGNRQPTWNTPAGFVGFSNYGEMFSYQLSAGDPDTDSLSYSGTGIPTGYSLSSSGLLTGTPPDNNQSQQLFTVSVTDGNFIVPRQFYLVLNNNTSYPIEWITPSGSLGNINEGDKSLFSLTAVSDDIWVRYEIVSGTLPNGLSLNSNTGNINGQCKEVVSSDTVFTFTVRAYTPTLYVDRDFEITVVDFLEDGAARISVKLWGIDKIEFFDNQELISDSMLYRQEDAQHGNSYNTAIDLVLNLGNNNPEDIFDTLNGIRRTNLYISEAKYAKAKDGDGNYLYDVVYREIIDEYFGTDDDILFPQPSITIKSGELKKLREKLLAEFAISGTDEQLPLFMTTVQDSGDILGWIPALVIAYIKPGDGEAIVNRINNNDIVGKRLLGRKIRVDRLLISPHYDDSFEAFQILYDGEY